MIIDWTEIERPGLETVSIQSSKYKYIIVEVNRAQPLLSSINTTDTKRDTAPILSSNFGPRQYHPSYAELGIRAISQFK